MVVILGNILRLFGHWLKRELRKAKVVAIEECGLDYERLHFCPVEILKKFCSGVAHSFTGSAQDCDRLLSFSNLLIGINGCSLKTVENLDVVKGIPLDRLMIETDSPYCEIKNTHAGIKFVKSLWPSKKKEKYDSECIVKGRNEPCLVRQVLEVVAGCKGIADIDQLGKTLYHNTCRVFFPQDLDSAADALLAAGRNAS